MSFRLLSSKILSFIAIISATPLFLLCFIDNMLLNGNKMQFWTGKFGMLRMAIIAFKYFELIQNRFVPIPQKAIMEIVHL